MIKGTQTKFRRKKVNKKERGHNADESHRMNGARGGQRVQRSKRKRRLGESKVKKEVKNQGWNHVSDKEFTSGKGDLSAGKDALRGEIRERGQWKSPGPTYRVNKGREGGADVRRGEGRKRVSRKKRIERGWRGEPIRTKMTS